MVPLLRIARLHDDSSNFAGSFVGETVPEEFALSMQCLEPSRRLAPLVHRSLLEAGILDRLPIEVADAVISASHAVATQQMIWRYHLSLVCKFFSRRDIPVIVLKGGAYAGTLYSTDCPRGSSDLDILVPPEQFTEACQALQSLLGWFPLEDAGRVHFNAAFYEKTFFHPKGDRPHLDVHRGLTYPFLFEIDTLQLWHNSRPHPSFADPKIRMLDAEDSLLHLAVHAFRDLNFCTHNLLDAHYIFTKWAPDTTLLISRARSWGADKVLSVLLCNCREVLDTPVPADLLQRLELGRIRRSIARHILAAPAASASGTDHIGYQRLRQILAQALFSRSVVRAVRFQLHFLLLQIKDALERSRRTNRRTPLTER